MFSISRCIRSYGRKIGTHLCSRRAKSSESFEVARLSTVEEVHEVIFSRAAQDGWRPGAFDHRSFYAVDSNRFFVGKLNGEPICSVYFLKYSDEYMFGGGFLVNQKYRSNGYGAKLWDAVIKMVEIEKYNLCGECTLEMLPFYANNGGMPAWCMQSYNINAGEAMSKCEKYTERNELEIVSHAKDVYPALLDYDTSVHVYERPSFLESWVSAPSSHCSVAVDENNGKVAGYGVVRRVLGDENGWRVGPLFADNSSIAKKLYQDLFVKVASENPKALITLEASYGRGFDPDSRKLLSELNGTPIFQMMRIYTKGIPKNMPLHKIFVMT